MLKDHPSLSFSSSSTDSTPLLQDLRDRKRSLDQAHRPFLKYTDTETHPSNPSRTPSPEPPRMASTRTKVGHGLAKVLGIKLQNPSDPSDDKLTRGESVFSISSADDFVEQEPTVQEWLADHVPRARDVRQYVHNLFPFTKWIGFYNLQWLYGDLVAGITIGAVVVPQSMAYAKLASLDPQFGLYSSFMGVLIYWFFATSKDITIGPVAVMSTIVGTIVDAAAESDPTIPGYVIASALALVAGGIVCGIGLLRLGWLVNFISLTSIAAFMTGSAISIAVGQVPALMGIPKTVVSTKTETYLIVVHTLQHLGSSKLDAAIGLTALTMLYLIRFAFNFLAKRIPSRRKAFFFCNTLRTVFVILLYTLISFLVNRHVANPDSKKASFAIVGKVPRGFQDAGVPRIDSHIVGLFSSKLPASVIVLLIEHISISKSFGRVNGYQIDPSQELVAIGVTNLLSPFLAGYPATGSFSRTAIKSKAGVRTPLAGVITAIVVLLAIYALTRVFYYIPSAALSAVIIHAVGDLITPPDTVMQFWRVSPLEVVIFFAGVFVTVFSSIENGIYTTVCVSAALLLFRIFKAQGRLLGAVKVHSVVGDQVLEQEQKNAGARSISDSGATKREIFLPVDHDDGTNPSVAVRSPHPGIFIYRFTEGYNYPNADHHLDHLVQHIFSQTRKTNPASYTRLGDRPWNDPGTTRRQRDLDAEQTRKPSLKAIILDFSSVNNVDITSIQHLIDVRNQLDRYTAPDRVQWHFACINNRWTKRALASAGFGFPSTETSDTGRWRPIFSVAEIGGDDSAAEYAALDRRQQQQQQLQQRGSGHDIERGPASGGEHDDGAPQLYKSAAGGGGPVRVAALHGLNRPLFHIDLSGALQSAVANLGDEADSVSERSTKGLG